MPKSEAPQPIRFTVTTGRLILGGESYSRDDVIEFPEGDKVAISLQFKGKIFPLDPTPPAEDQKPGFSEKPGLSEAPEPAPKSRRKAKPTE